jgi:hypothetical protein
MASEPDKDKYLPTNAAEVNFSLLLSGVIDSIKKDPAQLRNAIYELTRVQLQREAWNRNVNILEMRRLMLALETAIERVETVSHRQDAAQPRAPGEFPENPNFISPGQDADNSEYLRAFGDLQDLPYDHRTVLNLSAEPTLPERRKRKGAFVPAGPVFRGAIVAILFLTLFVVLDQKFSIFGRISPAHKAASQTQQQNEVTAETQTPPAAARSSGLPLPAVYGVYAVSGEQLYELEPLVGRVPDQKVFMSTPVKLPSRVTVPDGRLAFIIFRRDVAANAPDRVGVRIIAKVKRAMTFNTGQSNTVSLDDQWTIRGNSFEFRVAPMSENPEMLLIRPENSDFQFPPGRYGLVIKGLAYDFSVAGQISDPLQCLERVEAANGAFYSACRAP